MSTTLPIEAVARTMTSSFGLIAVVMLVLLLITKEVARGLDSPRAKHLNQSINVVIAPLIIVVLLTAAFKLLDVLQ